MGVRMFNTGVVLVGLTLSLVACTAPLAPPGDGPSSASDRGALAPPDSSPISTPTVAPIRELDACSTAVAAYPGAAATDLEQLGGVTLAVPADRGPMPYAAGEVTLNEDGVPVAYTVAANDVLQTISARLCVSELWLQWVNYVRRDGEELFVGDTLNLDAHTILSVGDQNGVVHNNAFPVGFIIPPQR